MKIRSVVLVLLMLSFAAAFAVADDIVPDDDPPLGLMQGQVMGTSLTFGGILTSGSQDFVLSHADLALTAKTASFWFTNKTGSDISKLTVQTTQVKPPDVVSNYSCGGADGTAAVAFWDCDVSGITDPSDSNKLIITWVFQNTGLPGAANILNGADFTLQFKTAGVSTNVWDNPTTINISTPVAPVPEPASLLLLGSGLAAVGARYRRKRNQ